MPSVSEAQRRAMFAAASGHSTLGIPQSVGKEFADADPGGKLPARIKKAEGGEARRPAPHIHIHLPSPPPILMMRRSSGGFDTGVEEDIDPHLLSRDPIGGPPLPRPHDDEPGPVSIQGSVGRGGNTPKEPPQGVIMLRRRIPLGDRDYGIGGTVTDPPDPSIPGMAGGGIPRLGAHIPHMESGRGMGLEKLGLSTRPGSGGLGRFGSSALHFEYGGDVHEHMAGGGGEPPPVDYFERAAIRGATQQQKIDFGSLPTASGGPMVPGKVLPAVPAKAPDPYTLAQGPWGTKPPEVVHGRGPQMPSAAAPPERQQSATGGVIHDMQLRHGPTPGDGGGRTDRLPTEVDVGSYVVPADVISSMGQGHTQFGYKVLRSSIGDEHGHMASGGRPSSTSILAAPGEYIISRAAVDALGQRGQEQGMAKKGETITNTGHRLLDEMIARVRKFQIDWLRHAPPPKKSAGGPVTRAIGFAMAA